MGSMCEWVAASKSTLLTSQSYCLHDQHGEANKMIVSMGRLHNSRLR